MECHEVEPFVEALADGEDVPAAAAEHAASCARCMRAVANARAIELFLRNRQQPLVPAEFTTAVMARVRRERWRAEQIVDWSFNAALALGGILIVVGLVGLAWATGLITIGGDVITLVRSGSELLAARVAPQMSTIATAGLLVAATLAGWWWAEADPTI